MGKGAQVGDGEAVTASDLRGFLDALAGLAADVDDAERVEQLAALEDLQAACVAAQARVMVGLSDSQVGAQAAAGLVVRQRGRGVPEQVGLACRISPQAAAVRLGRARAWSTQLPFTLRALGAAAARPVVQGGGRGDPSPHVRA
ncbi:hypothetical protein [Luteipulveratus flavus]|uniref:Anti-sigma factor n=1 Tax=Luteipulveratus flavus TaxID=3031728 RepID=A0ABT6C221_9MICO|nr:hypothetical protein [Luteipulveratus sp. YIM 133296]MDF8262939.1 hypothetical protein [Luteipulveratus sp. YIM 133296]